MGFVFLVEGLIELLEGLGFQECLFMNLLILTNYQELGVLHDNNTIMHVNIASLVARINLARSQRIQRFLFPTSKIAVHLLFKLCQLGILRGYHIKGNYIEVVMKYVNNRTPFVRLRMAGGLGRNNNISYNRLCHICDRAGSSVFLLSTVDGFLFSSECLVKRIGGILFLKIDL